MKRRSSIAMLVLAAATLAGGCTTFTDNDAAARVDDVKYTHAELVAELEDLGASPDQLIQAENARGQVSAWIAEQVAAAQDPALAEAAYAEGVFVSGSICLEIIAVETQAAADAALAELTDGTPFTDVFATANIDPSLAQTNGRIGCLGIAELDTSGSNPLVQSVLTLTADDPYSIALLPGETAETDLYVVSHFIPYDELGPDETPVVVAGLGAESLDLDVYVDPQIGTYDSTSGTVIPLG